MNCQDATNLLFAERDRTLARIEREALDEHLAGCPDCKVLRAGLADAATAWRETSAATAVPDPGGEWRVLRERLRPAPVASHGKPRHRRSTWIAWTGLPLAAAAAVALVVWLQPRPFAPSSDPDVAATARAEFVEAGDRSAATVVYVDQESGWLIVWAAPSL
jgi:hypothetical protein